MAVSRSRALGQADRQRVRERVREGVGDGGGWEGDQHGSEPYKARTASRSRGPIASRHMSGIDEALN
jgi:hypothetical protein